MQDEGQDITTGELEDGDISGDETNTTEGTDETSQEGSETKETEGPETAADTVRKAYESLKEKDQSEEDIRPSDAKEHIQAKPEKTKKDRPVTDDLEPPARFRVQDKEAFNKLPKHFKGLISGMVKDLQADYTRSTQEISQRERETESLTQAIKPYLTLWGTQKMTPSQAIAALGAAQTRLMEKPNESIAFLIRDTGADVNKIITLLGGKAPDGGSTNGSVPDISQHPEFQRLTRTVSELHSERERLSQAQFDEEVSGIVAELESVRNEKDSQGRYRYPELHDDDFLESVKPLVSALRETFPSASWSELTKKAYYAIKGAPQGNFSNGQTRLPAREQVAKARQASVSVKGRGSQIPNGMYGLSKDEMPETAQDAARLAYELLTRGE